MKRLLAFGCSNTQGHGLPGFSWKQHSRTASTLAWPQFLSDRLDRTCDNQGYTGASNKLIADFIVNQDYKQDDLVVVLWTSFTRSHVFMDNGKKMRLLPSDCEKSARDSQGWEYNPKITKLFYRHFYAERDFFRDNLVEINFAKQYLDSIHIENYHFCWDPDDDGEAKLMPHWNRTDLRFVEFDPTLGLAADHEHPSSAAHEQMAEHMLTEISKKRNSS